MSTNTLEAPLRSSLFRGPSKDMGAALRKMSETGRAVVREQRWRWTEAREFYRGNQWLQVNPAAGSIRAMARDTFLRSGRRRDVFNRLRQFTDGRVALYASEKPPVEVVPPDTDQQSIDGARQAEKIISANWGEGGWNVRKRIYELGQSGEIDGVAFLYVNWDPDAGPKRDIPIPMGADGMPLDRATLEMLKQVDPEGETLWSLQPVKGPIGDVTFRVVRPGSLSIDPFAGENWDQAKWIVESRIRPVEEVERRAGRGLKELIRESRESMGEPTDDLPGAAVDLEIDTGDSGANQKINGVIVHYAYITPHGDWPQGAHVEWADQAPGKPLLQEPWEDELPYRPFNPKPDGGHFLRCKGTVEELIPVQRRFNRILSLLHEWLDRVGRPPVGIPKGALMSDSIYRDEGYYEYFAGMGEPHYMQTPSEPAAVLTTHLQWMEQQMAEIAVVSNPTRGIAPGQGMEAAVGANLLIQQNEQQLSATEAEIVTVYEWGLSRALRLVGENYIIPRLISAPGVGDSEELAAFKGEMLHGAHRFRVTGRVTPKNKALQIQSLMQFAPILGPEIRPYVGKLVEGDIAEFQQAEEAQRQRQKRKNRMLSGLAKDETAQAVFADFEAEKMLLAQALQAAASIPQPTQVPGMPLMPDQAEPGMEPMGAPEPPNPMQALAMAGIQPTRLLDMLDQAGVPIPRVEEFDNPAQQVAVLDLWCVSEAFEHMPPVVVQATREYRQALLSKQAMSLASLQGMLGPEAPASAPAEKGQPSPPREPGTAGGQPAAPPSMTTPAPGGAA